MAIYEVVLKSDENMGAQFNYSPYGVARENVYYTTWRITTSSEEIASAIKNDPEIDSWKIVTEDDTAGYLSADNSQYKQWVLAADETLPERKEYSWLKGHKDWMREKAKIFGGEVAWLMWRLDDLDSEDLTVRDMELFEKLQSLSPEAFDLLMARQKWLRDQEPVTFTTLDYLDWISNGK